MKSAWDRRIARAEELAKSCASASEMLNFYAKVAALQRTVFDQLSAAGETRPVAVATYFPRLIELVEHHGPPAAAEYARSHRNAAEYERLILLHWNDPGAPAGCGRFFARALLQPFAESLAMRGAVAADASGGTCPFCGARPAAAALRGEGEGGKRFLVCSLCNTEWEFRRILCPNCKEEDKEKLPVYVSEEFDYIRVEACDTCGCYVKAIDLTKNGLAVPIVDEIASVPLDIWAEEQGYNKIEANLLGA